MIRTLGILTDAERAQLTGQLTHLSDAEWVRQLYILALDRTPSDAEVNFQATQGLHAHGSRAGLLNAFITGGEYQGQVSQQQAQAQQQAQQQAAQLAAAQAAQAAAQQQAQQAQAQAAALQAQLQQQQQQGLVNAELVAAADAAKKAAEAAARQLQLAQQAAAAAATTTTITGNGATPGTGTTTGPINLSYPSISTLPAPAAQAPSAASSMDFLSKVPTWVWGAAGGAAILYFATRQGRR